MTSRKPARRRARGRPTVLALALAALLALLAAGPAGAVIVTTPSGKRISIALRRGVNPASVPGSMASRSASPTPFDSTGGNVTWHGGPVVHGPLKTYAYFWDPSGEFTTTTKNLIERYFTDVAADSGKPTNAFAITAEYGDGRGPATYAQTVRPAQVDTAPYPVDPLNGCVSPGATCVTDAQIVAELRGYISAHNLPTGMQAQYYVFTPGDVVTCIDGGDADLGQCSQNAYCAYHSYDGSGENTLLYADDPFIVNDPKACQSDGHSNTQKPNTDFADVVLKAVSHEQRETITDPLGNAWFDGALPQGLEIDDKCNAYGTGEGYDPRAFTPTLGGSASAGNLFNQIINSNHYYLQSEWSNRSSGCDMVLGPNPAFSASPGSTTPGHPVTFNASTTKPGAGAITGYDWDYGDGSPHGSGLASSHAYAAAGTYTVTLRVFDTNSLSAATTRKVVVTTPPPAPPPAPPAAPSARPAARRAPPAPTITSLSLTRSHFAAARSGATVSARIRRRAAGSTLVIRISRRARVTIRITRMLPGRRDSRNRCVAPSRRLRRHRRCTRSRLLSTRASFIAATGLSRHHLSGRLGGRRLAPGTYVLSATPAGGRTRTVRFTIAR